jgi:hypothetical protein
MKKKFDLRQDVTNRIIERLENVGKFEMPFLKCGARNFKSGHIYTNINVILTSLEMLNQSPMLINFSKT